MAPGFIAAQHLLVLVPVNHPKVVEAMHGVADELMSRCLGEQEAKGLISSTLTALGLTGWSISTDGPFAYPSDREQEVRQHVAAGCFVYTGSGHGPDGQPVYYILGG